MLLGSFRAASHHDIDDHFPFAHISPETKLAARRVSPLLTGHVVVSETPFMPLWVADFVGDTLDLDAKEIGAYMLILMTMWGRGGYLPNDMKKLQRVARCGRDWPRVWAAIEHYFTVEDGRITQLRLRKELQKVAAKREVNAQSGARGGTAKALKYKDQGLANATHSPKQPEPYPELYKETPLNPPEGGGERVDFHPRKRGREPKLTPARQAMELIKSRRAKDGTD